MSKNNTTSAILRCSVQCIARSLSQPIVDMRS